MTKQSTREVTLDDELLNQLSPADRKMVKELDMDGSGQVDLTEILGLLRHHEDNKGQMKKLFRTFGAVVGLLVLLLSANTVATFAVVEMSKENKQEGATLVSAGSGETVQIASSDMSVNADGVVVMRQGNGSRRLSEADGGIKTMPSMKKSTALASSLPDSVLMGLEEITVYSDKGHTLRFSVHGFARIPVLNSRCGNVVHFYTGWKGRITLDSTDMSFDDATAEEFKGAGFSLAVGGMNGRRLAGQTSTDGFFKHMEGMKASGAWKCGDVPLPQMTATNIINQVIYHPCGVAGSDTPNMCDSAFGGLIPGAGPIPRKHALASLGKASRMAHLLGKSSPNVIYSRTTSYSMRSPSYQVQVEHFPNHPTQDLVTIGNRATGAEVQFQQVAGDGRSHCQSEVKDQALAAMGEAEADGNVDTDMHFEFMDTQEEEGKVLRHFRMMPSSAFETYMGAEDASRPVDSYTEYWDIADSLTPYRILSGDGTLKVFESVQASCTDAEVVAEVTARAGKGIAELMVCGEDEKEVGVGRRLEGGEGKPLDRPKILSPYEDPDAQGLGYYMENAAGVTCALETCEGGDQDDVEALAANTEDHGDKADYARYLMKTKNPIAMPDYCYNKCKDAIDGVLKDMKSEADPCETGSMAKAINCLEFSPEWTCQNNPFMDNHYNECTAGAGEGRRAEAGEGEGRRAGEFSEEAQAPVKTLADGTQQVALKETSPQVQAVIAKELGLKSVNSARLLFNTTTEDAAMVVKSGHDSRRLFLGWNCPSKLGATAAIPGGWCKKWDFKTYFGNFKLTIKWGIVSGKLGIGITCVACVPILKFLKIPPPVKVDFCGGGSIDVLVTAACPGIPLEITGKVFLSVEGYADFSVLEISIAKITLGVVAGIATFKKQSSCWWVSGEGGRRRRWWSNRRRDWRACNYYDECDLKVGAFAEIRFTLFRVDAEFVYWVRHKCITITVKVKIYEFWLLFFGGWCTVWENEVYRKQL